MIDERKLKGKTVEAGKTMAELSKGLGINYSTFYRKIKRNSFKLGEVDALTRELDLSKEEVILIFFRQFV